MHIYACSLYIYTHINVYTCMFIKLMVIHTHLVSILPALLLGWTFYKQLGGRFSWRKCDILHVQILGTSLCWQMAEPGLELRLCYQEASRPDWCGSVDWVLACEPKGLLFNSQSGHKPGLWARSPVGGTQEETHTLMFLSLSFSLPSLSKNKQIKY